MVLVDTSSWIHFLRPDGDATVRARVAALLQAGTACWCPLVRLELWNGAGGDREKKVLKELERQLSELAMTPEVWNHGYELARRCRTAGVTAPATDLLVVACARHHGAGLEQADSDFDRITGITDTRREARVGGRR
ncbi:MAG: PIN domain-containing protein [Gemmatimonadetes bacterium]|nr:PIN domain-containing protein [Gemmatimonadota bacterium]